MTKNGKKVVDKDLEDFDDEEGGADVGTTDPLGEQYATQVGNSAHEELATKVNSLEDQLMRTQAELANIHKRSEAEIAKTHKYAIERFARELLSVVDSLERALEQKGDNADPVLTGVELTLKLLHSTLEKFAIKPVNPLGQTFNPSEAEAMSMQETADQAPGTVVNVLQKGYTLNDRLLRPALVVVAKAPQK